MNQTNRIGHGVAGAQSLITGRYSLVNATETPLSTIMDSVAALITNISKYAPFEVRLITEVAGGEMRTKTGVSGFNIQHQPAAGQPDGRATTLYLDQDGKAPSNLLIYNGAGRDMFIYITLLG